MTRPKQDSIPEAQAEESIPLELFLANNAFASFVGPQFKDWLEQQPEHISHRQTREGWMILYNKFLKEVVNSKRRAPKQAG